MQDGEGQMRVTDYPNRTDLATAKQADTASPDCPEDKAGLPAHILAEARFLRRLGFAKPLISALVIKAMHRGTSVEVELLASGHATPETYYEALAEMLDLPFLAVIDPSRVRDIDGSDFQLLHPPVARLQFSTRSPLTVVVPSARTFEALRERLEREPALREMLAVTHPKALRAAVWRAGRLRRVKDTVNRQFDAMPLQTSPLSACGAAIAVNAAITPSIGGS